MNDKATLSSAAPASSLPHVQELRLRRAPTAATLPSEEAADQNKGWGWDLATFLLLGVVGLLALCAFLSWMLWPMTPEEWAELRVPLTLQDAQKLGSVLSGFRDRHFARVVAGHAACYLYLQSFAIPGTVFFNLLGGALFGMTLGYPLCLAFNTLGSLVLYSQGQILGRRVVRRFFAKQFEQFAEWKRTYEDELLWKMIFLRLLPFSPNWFMNVACGQLRVARWKFMLAIIIGLTPYNFLSCKAGLVLSQLTSRNAIIDPTATAWLALIALTGLVGPPLAKRLLKLK